MEETRIQELRKGRELTAQKEENQYLKKLVEEQERAICKLENDIVQQNTVRLTYIEKLCVKIDMHIYSTVYIFIIHSVHIEIYKLV